jgi:glycosyltransferase involved in cell wall biosynthesis
MVLGMPVIATYTGGTGSLLEDKKEGILIQDGDAYSMAGAVLEVVSNPGYAAELGKNARIRARERHNPDTITNDLISIYSKIIPRQSE